MFLNDYKAPHDSCAVQPLLDWTPTPNNIVIGDFNSVYWARQPSTSDFYGKGENFIDESGYMNEFALKLANRHIIPKLNLI